MIATVVAVARRMCGHTSFLVDLQRWHGLSRSQLRCAFRQLAHADGTWALVRICVRLARAAARTLAEDIWGCMYAPGAGIIVGIDGGTWGDW